MKFIILGFLISLGALLIISNILEGGDPNIVTMYFLVFFIPILIISIMNGVILIILKKTNFTLFKKRVLSILPIIFLLFITFLNEVKLLFIDEDATYLGVFCSIGIGLTNLSWMIVLKKGPVGSKLSDEEILDNDFLEN